MREHSASKIFDLLFDLFPRELLRIIDQQADDFRIVNVTPPKLLGKLVVSADLLGQLSQMRQADAVASELTVLGAAFFPVRDATFVLVFFQNSLHRSKWVRREG